jgi:hypothetical protein
MGNEKRRFTRFTLKMNAILYDDKTSYPVDTISNLSIGGCLLAIDADLAPDSLCSLIIKLGMSENDLTVKIEGKIIRSEDGEVAIKFISVDPESLFHLQMLARYNSPEPEKIEEEIKQHPGIV